MTHAPPNDIKLTQLNAFIDQQVLSDLLRHKNRMFELLGTNRLIARSITEQHFLARSSTLVSFSTLPRLSC
jgi:hypothetical protein